MADHVTSPALAETGYVVLDAFDGLIPSREWLELEYVQWRSSGVTRFAPLASAKGQLECNGFWNHTPPRPDKDGVWIDSQLEIAPTLGRLAQETGACVGRCRVVELQPNEYADAVYNLHLDDNNRLNPPGTGWIVRGMLNLTDDPGSMLVLREDRFDPSTETRIPLPYGARVVVDTERLWHAVWHRGDAPRYGLVASWESGPALDEWIARLHGTSRVESTALDPDLVEDAQWELHRRIEERRRALEATQTSVAG